MDIVGQSYFLPLKIPSRLLSHTHLVSDLYITVHRELAVNLNISVGTYEPITNPSCKY